jgi:hypothetical protein
MAYTYDEFGNVVEYESEEERRRRELAEQPVKQTITYNPDGSQEMTIKGTPEALSAANPNTPTVTAPIAPDQTYGRMLQAESGNRDFDRQGRPVTSPKGAMFASQVMPATARQPGFGIRPAAAQTPDEYNRVGREYFDAMRRQFPGDEAAAIAAYNAGPGRVQQNIRANQGQMNVAQLPRETQQYLQRVQGGAAQPSQAQQAQAVQQPQPDSVINDQVAAFEARQPYSLATGQSSIGLQAPQAAAPAIDTRAFDFYQRNQDNPQALISMGFSDAPGMPDFLKDRMKNRAAELIQQQREETAAKQAIPNMSESDIARALREKTTGGSYLKAVLFGMLGMEQSAMAEAAKLGIGKETLTQINGQPALVKLAANGTPIEGYNAATGAKLKPEELVTAAQFGTTKLNIVGGTYVNDTTGEVGRVVTDERSATSYVQTDTGRKPMAGFRPQSSTGSLDAQRVAQVQRQNIDLAGDWERARIEIAKAGPEASARTAAEFNFKYGTNFAPQQFSGQAPQLDLTTGQMITPRPGAQAAPAPAPAGTTPAPSQAQQALTAQQRPAAQPATAPATAPAPAPAGATPAAIEAAQQIGIKRTESFNKILDEEVRPAGQSGDIVSSRRKQQFEIFDRPGVDVNKLFGLATGAGRSPGDQTWTIVRDIFC